MNKPLLLFITGFLLAGSTVFAQTIQNSVISSAGGSASAGNVKMDYTIGETVIATTTAGGYALTQGFHQTNLTLVAIENVELYPEMSIYPNPAGAIVNIDIPENYKLLDISMFDAKGKLLRTQPNASGLVTFDVNDLATGTYYLQVLNPENKALKTFKLIKTK